LGRRAQIGQSVALEARLDVVLLRHRGFVFFEVVLITGLLIALHLVRLRLVALDLGAGDRVLGFQEIHLMLEFLLIIKVIIHISKM
jgi:hypothetical protein